MAPPELATGPGHPDCHSENSPSLPGVTQSHLGLHLDRVLPLAHRLAFFLILNMWEMTEVDLLISSKMIGYDRCPVVGTMVVLVLRAKSNRNCLAAEVR